MSRAAKTLRVASVNVNGIRAAYRKDMATWLAGRDVDILCLQTKIGERRRMRM